MFVGNVKLFLDKVITIKSIRVVFKCEEWDKKKGPSCTLFSVESCIWSQQGKQKKKKSSQIKNTHTKYQNLQNPKQETTSIYLLFNYHHPLIFHQRFEMLI